MPYKDKKKKRDWQNLRNKLRAEGSKVTPAQYKRNVATPLSLGNVDYTDGIQEIDFQNLEMNERHILIGMLMQQLGVGVCMKLMQGEPVTADELELARKLCESGVKMERVAAGATSGKKELVISETAMQRRLRQNPTMLKAVEDITDYMSGRARDASGRSS